MTNFSWLLSFAINKTVQTRTKCVISELQTQTILLWLKLQCMKNFAICAQYANHHQSIKNAFYNDIHKHISHLMNRHKIYSDACLLLLLLLFLFRSIYCKHRARAWTAFGYTETGEADNFFFVPFMWSIKWFRSKLDWGWYFFLNFHFK